MSNATSSAISIQLPDDVKMGIDALAEEMGRSSDDLMVAAIARYVAEETPLVAEIKAGIAEADAGIFVSDEEMDEMWAEFGLEPDTARERAG